MITIYCTFCWRAHYAPSLDWWIANNRIGCGRDLWRYFDNRADYIRYVRHYQANGCQHGPLGVEQMRIEL